MWSPENGPCMMEGALGERLKTEYSLVPDETIAWASLIQSQKGRDALQTLWREYQCIAQTASVPFLATTPTRRADHSRLSAAGRNESLLAQNTAFLKQLLSGENAFAGGMLGCAGDAYTGKNALSERDALPYHAWQADAFAAAGVDFLYAALMPALPEAAGMARALQNTGLPYILSFSLEKNGCLVDGSPLWQAIETIDCACLRPPLLYMANCVHPDIVLQALSQPMNCRPCVRERFLGIQANTSPLPFSELETAADHHPSSPASFAEGMARLHREYGLLLFGGCCGTNGEYMRQTARLVF